MRKLLMTVATVAAVVTLAASSAEATNMKGKWGPGISFEETPLDVKFGLSPKSAVFFGLGFRDAENDEDTDFNLGAGFEYALFGNDDFNLNFQPSIQMFTGNGGTDIRVPLALAAEVWMNDRISVSMSHGIAFYSQGDDEDTEADEGGSTTGTFGSSVTAFRFRFYVK